ncbi:MAG TPA: hypothetical protein VFQ54_13510 [Thermomicrobiales bacterium]|nr:hypothetical protein [Thermomicrobiales bacterium]
MALKKSSPPYTFTSEEIAELEAALPPVMEMTDEEYRAIFEDRAQSLFGVGADEFTRRYRAGEYDLDDYRVADLAFFIPVRDGES